MTTIRVERTTSTVQRVALIFGVGFLFAAIAVFLVTGLNVLDHKTANMTRAMDIYIENVLI